MWPYWHLERAIGNERIAMWYDEETIKRWREIGLDDYEADEVAVKLGTLPHSVFPGWTESGLDADVYP